MTVAGAQLIRGYPFRAKTVVLTAVVGVVAAAAGCSSPEFRVNPPLQPSPTPIPTAVPSATVIPTAGPVDEEVLRRYRANPEWLISKWAGKVVYRDSIAVRGSFVREMTPPGDQQQGAPVEVAVTVDGEFSAVPGAYRGAATFELSFHHEPLKTQPGVGPWDTLIDVRTDRVAIDTTANNFKTYSTHAQFQAEDAWDRDVNKLPDVAMFLSLTLAEDQLLEYNMYDWLRFEPGQATLLATPADDGSEFWVVEAERGMPNGDHEQWKFWVDADEYPHRIELTTENETDPARGVRNGVFEISGIGECLWVYPACLRQ